MFSPLRTRDGVRNRELYNGVPCFCHHVNRDDGHLLGGSTGLIVGAMKGKRRLVIAEISRCG